MKKVLITLALASAVVSTGLAQGTINWNNANNSKISVNAVVGGAPTAATVANAGTVATTYYYALFYAPVATTVGGLSTAIIPVLNNNGTYVFQDSNWTWLNPPAIGGYIVGGAYATNAAAGRYTPMDTDSTHSLATITTSTTPERWVVLGWSASDGTSLADLATWYNGGNPSTLGWIGESVVSALSTPGDPTTTPPGTTPSVFPGAFTLGLVQIIPEPSTIALAGLGGLAMLMFRRRK
jgi:hypothetical protein